MMKKILSDQRRTFSTEFCDSKAILSEKLTKNGLELADRIIFFIKEEWINNFSKTSYFRNFSF